ncbi:hypothetical protein TWF569_009819 [Orbilia oligospora]|uniref:Uncharacterized protein n=1 Tax=Orbilia oligospora TaxID=2813651 RepID=A0A7C8JDD8_ORBOL|nr:hypothetical protein TWF706_006675 [Orbilia oligospora]KAF3112726.1 hypothetical protein TWF102_004122 [Orbilia oligospora]KAF3117653.1 hypothetical protein TWF103_004334 [Orbilia oligospora]KAF3142832.1 hypothetical protein TWF703_000336 [Orbilia oligospora]KAF3152056.1 hypothetical protein TWF594_005811 [Orbilia oligospora]
MALSLMTLEVLSAVLTSSQSVLRTQNFTTYSFICAKQYGSKWKNHTVEVLKIRIVPSQSPYPNPDRMPLDPCYRIPTTIKPASAEGIEEDSWKISFLLSSSLFDETSMRYINPGDHEPGA